MGDSYVEANSKEIKFACRASEKTMSEKGLIIVTEFSLLGGYFKKTALSYFVFQEKQQK
jgi:hypothetical protein